MLAFMPKYQETTYVGRDNWIKLNHLNYKEDDKHFKIFAVWVVLLSCVSVNMTFDCNTIGLILILLE